MAIHSIDARTLAGVVSMSTAWLSKYVGIPFSETGLTAAGCHCWGLVRLVLSQEADVDVPSYGEHSAADLVAAARRMNAPPPVWTRVNTPRMFDVVLMTAMDKQHGRLVAHAGIMSSNFDVLHVWRATDAVNMPITHPRVRAKIVGFFRHARLAHFYTSAPDLEALVCQRGDLVT